MSKPLKSKRRARERISTRSRYTAPYRGLNTRDPEAQMRPGFARGLVNWWPNGLQVETRPGSISHMTGFTSPVKALASWTGPSGAQSLWAFTNLGVYDATVSGPVGAAIHPRTDGEARTTLFSNSANTFLFAVNGVDDMARYNGTAWTNVVSFPITGGGTLPTNEIVNLGVHQRRLWFVRRDTTDAFYLGVDLIAGDATKFPLGAQFTLGGHLLAITTWSVDGGAGPDDYCAFISSKGQVAVYAGTDPNATATWGLKGVFNLPEPLGWKCAAKVGRECQITTRGGVFPLSGILTGNAEQEELAITDLIRPTISAAGLAHGDRIGWQLATLLSENLLLVNVPTQQFKAGYQFAMNTVTKAWTQFYGWPALCWENYNNGLYFGTETTVERAWVTFADNGIAITASAKGHYDSLGAPGIEKHWKLVRPFLSFTGKALIGIGLDVDYRTDLAFGSAPLLTNLADVWNDPEKPWNEAVWAALESRGNDWLEYSAWPGTVVSVRLRVISSRGKVQWSATDVIYESGAIF